MDFKGILTQKVGPLQTWAWILIVASVVALGSLWSSGKKGKGAPNADKSATSGKNQFSSRTSNEKIDPTTGERYSSSYESSGDALVSPGAIGIPQGYPMSYSSGDVYVNLPPSTINVNEPPDNIHILPFPYPTPPPTPPPWHPPPPPPPPAQPPPPPAPAPEYWLVQPGDNLWNIAKATLRRRWGRDPSNADILTYWPRIWSANPGHRSNDPNLIFPGERFLLP